MVAMSLLVVVGGGGVVVATVAAVAVLVVVLAIHDGSLVISSCCTARHILSARRARTTHMPAADGQNPALLEYTTLRLRELCDKRAWIVLYFAGVFCPPVVPWLPFAFASIDCDVQIDNSAKW